MRPAVIRAPIGSMAAQPEVGTVVPTPILRAKAERREHVFFVMMASVAIVTVFAGFAPTFYLRGLYVQHRPMSFLLHVHGVVFSAWMAAFFLQTLLIASGSRRLHRRIGWAAAGLATLMIILVTAAVVEQLRRVRGFPPPALSLALSAFDIIVFATLVGAAVHRRKRADWHKRFMLSATIVLLGAPLFRIVIHSMATPDMANAGFITALLVDAFFLPCFAYDLVSRGKIHAAYYIALALIVTDQIAQVEVVTWAPWIKVANGLQRLVV